MYRSLVSTGAMLALLATGCGPQPEPESDPFALPTYGGVKVADSRLPWDQPSPAFYHMTIEQPTADTVLPRGTPITCFIRVEVPDPYYLPTEIAVRMLGDDYDSATIFPTLVESENGRFLYRASIPPRHVAGSFRIVATGIDDFRQRRYVYQGEDGVREILRCSAQVSVRVR